MTDIIRERDERGGYIVTPCWWKLSFDIKTPTWQKFGIFAFAEAYTEVEGREATLAQARKDYEGAEIISISFAPCTAGEAERYETKRQRLTAWLKNTRDGVPNTPAVLSMSPPIQPVETPPYTADLYSWTCPDCNRVNRLIHVSCSGCGAISPPSISAAAHSVVEPATISNAGATPSEQGATESARQITIKIAEQVDKSWRLVSVVEEK
jgi:hypothetical protein